MGTDNDMKQSWHLDKGVPIALIASLLMTIVVTAMAWSKMDARIEAVEKAQAEAKMTSKEDTQRLDRKLDEIQKSISGFREQYLQQQIDRAAERNNNGLRNRN